MALNMMTRFFALVGAVFIATAHAQAQCPEVGISKNRVTVEEGFPIDPKVHSIVPGGSLDISKCAGLPGSGLFNKQADLVVTYKTKRDAASASRLIFETSEPDTMLLINDPTGKWHFDDGGGKGLKPAIRFPNALPGRYDIWVAAMPNKLARVNLTITELDGPRPRPVAAAPPPEPPSKMPVPEPKLAEPPRMKNGGHSPPPMESPTPKDPRKIVGGEPDFTSVAIYFGTDRKQQGPPKSLSFGVDRAQKLTVGRVTVTVPRKVHKIGHLERPWEERWFGIDVGRGGDPTRFFTISSISPLTATEFLRELKQRFSQGEREEDRGQAFVFIHGYNVSFEYAAYRAGQIAYDLQFAGVPFLYSWPSAGTAAGYVYDEDSARLSEGYLREFLDRVLVQSGAQRVHLIAHSMGNVPLLRVLTKLAQEPNRPRNIGQIILAAPDVDWQEFHGIASSIFATKLATDGFTTLYASASDRALQKAAEIRRGMLRAGQIPNSGPLIVAGVHTIDVTATGMDIFSINHSTYAESREIINDVIGIFKGISLPKSRTPILLEQLTGAGPYWKYPH